MTLLLETRRPLLRHDFSPSLSPSFPGGDTIYSTSALNPSVTAFFNLRRDSSCRRRSRSNRRYMHRALIALYGGPDQIMGVGSAVASFFGLLLLFWNRVVGIFFRIVRSIRGTGGTPLTPKGDSPDQTV